MKKVGLVGGISWVSTLDYYREINKGVNERLGGLSAAELLLYSLDFGQLQKLGWDHAYHYLRNACITLQQASVDGIALCANTAHLYVDQLREEIPVPFIDLLEATVKTIQSKQIDSVALLGTSFTMERSFFKEALRKAGIQVLIPESTEERAYVQQTIRDELGKGLVRPETRTRYQEIIKDLHQKGARGLILGCTELPLLIQPDQVDMPLFDTVQIHTNAITDFILS
jgi:aspartate racemase